MATTRAEVLASLERAKARFDEVQSRGADATSHFNLMMGYWPCWTIHMLANHVRSARCKLAELPPTLFDDVPMPDTSYIPDEGGEFEVANCCCPKHSGVAAEVTQEKYRLLNRKE